LAQTIRPKPPRSQPVPGRLIEAFTLPWIAASYRESRQISRAQQLQFNLNAKQTFNQPQAKGCRSAQNGNYLLAVY